MTTSYTREYVIDFLLSLGLPPLPVAPKQSADKYPASYKDKEGAWQPVVDKEGNKRPLFTGKNPSYLYAKGSPRIVRHKDYQHKQPTKAELARWFCHPDVGIGALGTDKIIWLDFDVKQFENQEECDRRFNAWLELNPTLKGSWTEQTHSGGYRVAVKVPEKPTFTNFSLDGIGGKHHGEALGYGRFTVLAPTIGVSGNPYVCLNLAPPVEVESLESIGIFPITQEKTKKQPQTQAQTGEQSQTNDDFNFEQQKFADEVSIKFLISANIQAIMGDSSPPDRSQAFTKITREFLGWSDWLQERNIGVKEDIPKLLLDAADNMGLESLRVRRIFNSINIVACLPGIHFTAGDAGCWQKLKKNYIHIFNRLCPDEIKEALKIPVKHTQMMPNGVEFQSPCYVNPDQLNQWYNNKKYTPTIAQNSPDIDLSGIPKKGVIVGIKTPMGGGKTEAGLNEIKKAESDKIRAFWISSRVKLIQQTTARAWGKVISMYLLNEEDGEDLLLDVGTHLALCGESSYKLDGYFAGVDIYIDEATSVFKQLLSGGTVAGSRQALILEVLKKAFNECNRVFLMDANLNDKTVELVATFAAEKEVIKIENTYTRGSADIKIIQTNVLMPDGSLEVSKKDKSPLIEKLLNYPEEKFIIPCDSKRTCNTVEKLLFEDGRWGFNLNQETSVETWQELFERCPRIEKKIGKLVGELASELEKKWSEELLTNPDVFFRKYNPEFFVYSPTAESGVSIIGKYFTQTVSLLCGVIGTDSQTQMLFRERNLNIPRYVSCPEVGLKNETTYPFTHLIADALKTILELNSECYQQCPSYEEVLNLAKQRVNKDWANYSFVLETTEHFEKNNLRACLMFQLKSMGHSVEIVEELQNETVNELTKKAHTKLLEQEATEIFDAPPFEDLETAKKVFKETPNKVNARRKEKTRILTRLPGIEESLVWSEEFILECFVKDKHCLRQNERYWLLMNPEVEAKSNDFWTYIKLSSEFVTNSTLKNEQQTFLIGLRKLGIDTLIKELENGYTFTKDTPEIQSILTKARKDKKLSKIKQFQPNRETINKEEVLRFIGSLLSLVGVELKLKERARGEDGKRHQWYELKRTAHQHPFRLAMLEGIERQYQEWEKNKYIKPDWEYLVKEGQLPEEFKKTTDENDNYQLTIKDGSKPFDKESSKPFDIEIIAFWLANCRDVKTLAILKSDGIPSWVFRDAVKLLSDSGLSQWIIDWIDYWDAGNWQASI